MKIKFFAATGLIALLSFICGLFLPWWTIALAAFLVSALIPQTPQRAFLSGFVALFLLWGGMALGIDLANESILSTRVAGILPLGGSPYALIFVTALVGALVGGGASLTAAYLKK
jgi:cellulose synthase/poly-beta-1,6-N-acetylglucosamine synthase-like glycosyltransferase